MTIHRAYGHVDRAAQRADAPLRVVMCTEGRKADGIDLRMAGARLDRFRSNPVLGYGHDYYGRDSLPIGRVENVAVDEQSVSGDLVFDADDTFAMEIERKMRGKFINAVSIGFSVNEWEGKGDYWSGGVAAQWELSELSVVPIGMDSNALVSSGRSLIDDADRRHLRALLDEYGPELLAAALARNWPLAVALARNEPPPALPAPEDPKPAEPAGFVVSTAERESFLSAFVLQEGSTR